MITTILFLLSWFWIGQLAWYLIVKDIYRYRDFISLDIFMLPIFVVAGYVSALLCLFIYSLQWIADGLNRRK